MGWILLQIILLFSLHITATFAEEQNKEKSGREDHGLGSFLRNVLDSSHELSKIRDEIRANEAIDNVVHQHSRNNKYSQQRKKRKAKEIPEVQISGAKGPNTLRRVLDLYMKRARLLRHGKVLDSKGIFSESHIRKRDSLNEIEKHKDKSGQECGHTATSSPCENKKTRRRRWRGRSRNYEKNKAQNTNIDESSSVDSDTIVVVNGEAAATSDIQSNDPDSNIAQQGISDAQNQASHQENALPTNSMVSKQSNNPDSSANLPPSAVPGSSYDLDCVHEITPLEESFSRNFKESSSLTDDVSNLKPTNDIAINGQKTAKYAISALAAQTANLNEQSLKKMARKQKHEGPKGMSYSEEPFDVVHPIVLEVLDKVSKESNKKNVNSANVDTDNNLRQEVLFDKFTVHKDTFNKNEYETNTKVPADRTKVFSSDSSVQNSYDNDLAKKEPLSKADHTSPENDLLLKPEHVSSKTGYKPSVSNTKENMNNFQKSKLSESFSVHKTPSISKPIYKPATPIIKSAQKYLTHSGQQKIAPLSLYSKHRASSRKGKLNDNRNIKTGLYHSSKSHKAPINKPRTQIKAKNSKLNLNQKAKSIKQRNSVEETSRIQLNTEDVELKDDINKRNSRGIKFTSQKQQNILAFSEDENENMKLSNADGTLTSERHDPIGAEEDDDVKNNQQLMNINKRSLNINEGKQQEELLTSGAAENVAQENKLSAGQQSEFSQPTRRKRYVSRKGKRRLRQEGDSKLNSGDKYAHKNYYFAPENRAKHTEGENKEDSSHLNILGQVEDMILALKEKKHKDHSEYGSGTSQRTGRGLHSITDEAIDYSDYGSDNDDYYYYDEADVDKHKPEHSKLKQHALLKNNQI